jgi:hypothetical protein
MVDPSADSSGLRSGTRRLFEWPVLLELLELLDHHDHPAPRDDLELVPQHDVKHVPVVGHAGPADGNGHRVLLPDEEHQL